MDIERLQRDLEGLLEDSRRVSGAFGARVGKFASDWLERIKDIGRGVPDIDQLRMLMDEYPAEKGAKLLDLREPAKRIMKPLDMKGPSVSSGLGKLDTN